ncbi:malonic semialdehyde reductase [Phenylobacterium sp. LjRoot219]|uniref:malonic semialdehyde reductase n=1 Tax=Phenylobacterium sp. LjRoot219 TaxID=3342283 RepID=UPI003ECE709C
MSQRFAEAELDQLFRTARTRNSWRSEPVPEALIHELYELAKWGPTSANLSPGRFVFLTTEGAKNRIAPFLSNANRAKSLAAPVIAIVAYDLAFAQHAPRLFPHAPGVKDWFGDPAVAQETAFRNGSLQGAYLIMAARSLGLDCGPMSGFDAKGVDAEFFAGTTWRSNFVCNLGYGSDENLFERLPRLAFEEACQLL